jgi:Tfp pilus assembly protein PilX
MIGSTRHAQQGAATLVVVMVLFFIIAMMAAYANRNLVFEQRISSNYYRSGLASETAEAGLEWTIAKLNSGLIDSACVNDSTQASGFRDRYLDVDASRAITTNLNRSTPIAACVITAGQGLKCICREDGETKSLTPPTSGQFQPMFGVALTPVNRPGVVRATVTACTDTLSNCSSTTSTAVAAGFATATTTVDLALLSAVKMPPASPLVVRLSVDLGGTGLGLHNAELNVNGLLLQSGGSLSGTTARSTSLPGTPVKSALIVDDATLKELTADQLFAKFFGMAPATYREQPAARRISCGDDCSATLRQAYANGSRLVWVDGPLNLRSNLNIGSASDPLVIVSGGTLTIEGPMNLGGLIYARGDASWTNGSGMPATLTGAMVVEGTFVASGAVDIVYRTDVLNTLNNQRGSFVRVPGSWTDTQ